MRRGEEAQDDLPPTTTFELLLRMWEHKSLSLHSLFAND